MKQLFDMTELIDWEHFLDKPFEIHGRKIDPVVGTVVFNNEEIHIRRKELEVLALLISARGTIVKRETFIKEVWSDNSNVGEKGLNKVVADLRKTLKENKKNPIIKTIPRSGYQLVKTVVIKDQMITFNESPKKHSGSLTGATLGPYILREVLGKGAMGTVYLGEQNKFIIRKVAIKTINKIITNHNLVARFQNERKLQGALSHPSIATIHEVGQQGDELYLVMEFINGGGFITYCDRLKLSIKDRIILFLKLCEAVTHAHQKGIIHRDINPKNILVQIDQNNKPIPKLIDFGISKMLNSIQSESVHTRFGTVMGTLQYTSPEQLSGKWLNIDTRSDIYSLGIVLFELLVGFRPLTANEIELLVHSDKSQSTDTHIKTAFYKIENLDKNKLDEIADNRSIHVRNLNKLFAGDLASIIKKCIEFNPENRYSNVHDLSKDLSRWLENKPVSAAQYGFVDKLLKNYKRHRLVSNIAAASILTIAILTFNLVNSYLKSYSDTIELANKTQEIQRASDEKDITLDFQVKQLAKLSPEKIGSSFEMFLSEKISSNELNLNPDELSKINFTNAGRRLMFDEIIEPTLMSIRSDLKEYPQIQYSLFKRSFSLTFNLGFFDKSLLILDEVSQLIENKSLEKDKMFQVLKQKAGVLTSMNEVVQALNILEEVCNQIGVFKGKENKDYYDCQFRYASTLFSTNDKQKALNLMAETIEKLKTNEITDKALLVRMLNNYATGVTNYKFDFIHAHSLYSEAYSLSNEIHGEQHIMTLHILDNLGNSLRNLKDYERAYKYSEKVYELRKIKLGSDHIDTLFSLKNLAIILIEIGETDKALKKINHIINTLTENSSQDSSLLLTVSNTKSYIYSVQKKYNEAIDLLKNSLIRHIEFYGHNSSEVAYVYKQLAEVNLEMGQTANAKKYFVIALGLIVEIYGENDRDSIEIKSVLEQI